MKSRQVFACLAAGGMAVLLVSCGSGRETQAPVAEAPGDCPPGIAVTDGWMALPAVSGNPGAVYFSITNQTDRQVTIRGADVLGAQSAMLHETATWSNQADMQELFQQPVGAGETVLFAPGGKHVMAFGMGAGEGGGMEPGSETEVTLTFVGGDKCSFPVTAYPAGQQPPEKAE